MKKQKTNKPKKFLTKKELEHLYLCVQFLKEQHIKIMLEGQDYTEDWVTKKADKGMRILKKLISN